MDIEKTFSTLGGIFLNPVSQIKSKLADIDAFIFDWDGVFNPGMKTGDTGSPFSEIDSMGINLLRFSRWLSNHKITPVFIITGEHNPAAVKLSQREHYNAVFMNFKDKRQALKIIEEKYRVERDKLAIVFDDVLDIGIARLVRLAFCIGHKATPLFEKYIREQDICDYVTGAAEDKNAVREICELIMGIEGSFTKTIEERIAYSNSYQEYLAQRNKTESGLIDGKEIFTL